MTGDPRSWRELRHFLRLLGGTVARTRGSHEIWKFGSGKCFTVVRNHLGRDVPRHVLARFRRLRRELGALDEPPLLTKAFWAWVA